MWRVAWRGLFAHKARVVLTVLAVLMGVAFITSIYTLTDSTRAGFDKLFTTVNAGIDLQVQSVNRVDRDDTGGPGDLAPVAAGILDEVRRVDGVRFAEGLVFRPGVAIVGRDGDVVPFFGPSFGTGFVDRLELTPYTIREGRAPRVAGEVLVDARTIDDGDLEIGGPVTVILPTAAGSRHFTVVGSLDFGDSDSFSGAQVVMFTLSEAQRLFELGDAFDFIAVSVDDGADIAEVQRAVQTAVPLGIVVKTGAQVTEEQIDRLNGFVNVFGTVLLAFGFVGVFVAAFLIVNTFSIIVSQRVRELALLRALGASSRQVVGSVLLEAVVLGAVASLLGLTVGYGWGVALEWVTGRLGFDPGDVGTVLRPRTVIVGLAIGIGVTLLAAVIPAIRASRTPPLAAVRDIEQARRVLGATRTAIGLCALGAGAVALIAGSGTGTATGFMIAGGGALFVFTGAVMLAPWLARPASLILGAPLGAFGGITGAVARANLGRNPRRTGITASALMIGLALVTAVLVLTFSVIDTIDQIIDESIAAEVSVSTDFGGFSAAVRERIGDVPEVGRLSSYRQVFGQAAIDGDGTTLEAIEAGSIDTLLRLDVGEFDAAAFAAGGMLVSAERAQDKGWTVGTVVPARFSVAGAQPLPIAGVFERKGFFNDYVVSVDTFDELVNEPRDQFVFAEPAAGVSVEQLTDAIEAKIGEDFPNVEVQDRDELKAQQRQQAMIFLAFFVGLLLLTLLISFLGILNTLALSIIERTREIGLLRAVGAHRRQIRRMVRWEALLVAVLGGIIGVVIGVVLGIALQRALGEFGITRLVIPLPLIVVVLLVSGLAGLVAAIYPAWRAGRLAILDAIGTE